MKKITLILLTFTMLINFSSCKKEGCTDSFATNYNADAKKDDGSCLYDITGTWNMSSLVQNGVDVTSYYSTYRVTLDADGSSYTESRGPSINNGNWTDVWGTYSLNAEQTSITLSSTAVNYYDGLGTYSLSGVSATYAVNNFDNNSISLSLTSETTGTLGSLEITLTK